MFTEEQIRELAHSIWEQEGRPNGKDIEHYFRAKKILEERESPKNIINTYIIRIRGTIRCPDGDSAPRREIAIGKDDSNKLPAGIYLIRGDGTKVTLIIGQEHYRTLLHRYGNHSYISDAFQIMGFHLKNILNNGLDRRGTKVNLEVNGLDIVLSSLAITTSSTPLPSQMS